MPEAVGRQSTLIRSKVASSLEFVHDSEASLLRMPTAGGSHNREATAASGLIRSQRAKPMAPYRLLSPPD
jgi:hypothetical protein